MKSKTLGRTGLDVSIVGLGTVFTGLPHPYLPGDGADLIDEELGVQTIHAALEAGCTLIDTAPLYLGAMSEQIIGRALRERPDLAAQCIVTTKVGRLAEGRDYSFEAVLRSVEASQKRLGIEQFEVVYIHDAMGMPMGEIMSQKGALGALRKLQNEQIVRFVGSAANDPEPNADYIETGEFDAAVIADAWSLLNQTATKRILPAAEKHNVGLVTATPIERGLLVTGPLAGINYLNRNFSRASLEHVTKIQQLCQDYDLPLGAVALQWCTRHPQVTTTIPGGRSPQEAMENTQAGALDIPETFWIELEPLVKHWEQGVHR